MFLGDHMTTNKSLEYAYPTSETACKQGYRDSGCWFIAEYEYRDNRACEGYVQRIVNSFAGNESGLTDAIAAWKSLSLPVNVWSCHTVRNPHWIASRDPKWHTHVEQCPYCGNESLEVSQADDIHPLSGEPLYHEQCKQSDCRSHRAQQTLSMFV